MITGRLYGTVSQIARGPMDTEVSLRAPGLALKGTTIFAVGLVRRCQVQGMEIYAFRVIPL